MRLTYEETKEREAQIQEWIDEGLTHTQMAQRLGIRPEGVRRFLKVRGWETLPQRAARIEREANANT